MENITSGINHLNLSSAACDASKAPKKRLQLCIDSFTSIASPTLTTSSSERSFSTLSATTEESLFSSSSKSLRSLTVDSLDDSISSESCGSHYDKIKRVWKNEISSLNPNNHSTFKLELLGRGEFSNTYKVLSSDSSDCSQLLEGVDNDKVVLKVPKRVLSEESYQKHMDYATNQYEDLAVIFGSGKNVSEEDLPYTHFFNPKTAKEDGVSIFQKVAPLTTEDDPFKSVSSLEKMTEQQTKDYKRLLDLLLCDDFIKSIPNKPHLDLKLINLGRSLDSKQLVLLDFINDDYRCPDLWTDPSYRITKNPIVRKALAERIDLTTGKPMSLEEFKEKYPGTSIVLKNSSD
jgi:hypothetical protein